MRTTLSVAVLATALAVVTGRSQTGAQAQSASNANGDVRTLASTDRSIGATHFFARSASNTPSRVNIAISRQTAGACLPNTSVNCSTRHRANIQSSRHLPRTIFMPRWRWGLMRPPIGKAHTACCSTKAMCWCAGISTRTPPTLRSSPSSIHRCPWGCIRLPSTMRGGSRERAQSHQCAPFPAPRISNTRPRTTPAPRKSGSIDGRSPRRTSNS